jgi:hypothetical protein
MRPSLSPMTLNTRCFESSYLPTTSCHRKTVGRFARRRPRNSEPSSQSPFRISPELQWPGSGCEPAAVGRSRPETAQFSGSLLLGNPRSAEIKSLRRTLADGLLGRVRLECAGAFRKSSLMPDFGTPGFDGWMPVASLRSLSAEVPSRTPSLGFDSPSVNRRLV